MAFDLLQYDGQDLRDLPLTKGLEALQDVAKDCLAIHYVESHDDGKELYRQVEKLGLEGIVAKKKNSPNVAGRNTCWLKIKTKVRTEKEWNRRR